MKPEITVLMSVYNGAPHLRDAVCSILNQTFSDFEFLIIDDASTDESWDMLSAFAVKDSRIRLIKNQENAGLGRNLRLGVEAARGRWIARMDADDTSALTRFDSQLEFSRANPSVDIIGSYASIIDAAGQPRGMKRVPLKDADIKRLVWTCPLVHSSVLFRRESILAVGSYSGSLRRRQDYDLWFRCAAAGLNFANLPKVLVEHRVTTGTYKRNHVRAMWEQARIGWKGCWRVGANPVAYLGVAFPLVHALFPTPIRKWSGKLLSRLDPRSAAD